MLDNPPQGELAEKGMTLGKAQHNTSEAGSASKIKLAQSSLKRRQETYYALRKAFVAATASLTAVERVRVRRIVRLAAVACGEDHHMFTGNEVFK